LLNRSRLRRGCCAWLLKPLGLRRRARLFKPLRLRRRARLFEPLRLVELTLLLQ
jgi:hypothetical protein